MLFVAVALDAVMMIGGLCYVTAPMLGPATDTR